MKYLPVVILLAAVFVISCEKDSFITNGTARLSTSADTLYFDTVFTTTGSVTEFFRIYNNNNKRLRLSKVSLAGGSQSFFKMNVDGTATSEATDVDIDANDS